MRPRKQTPAALLPRIRAYDFAAYSGAELRDAFKSLQSRSVDGTAENLLPKCYAIVSEVVDRRLGLRATDEQLLAGIHLFRGRVVQMDAGEGKTVAAAFPAALHALMGRPVHVVTANDYLADRDAKLLRPVYLSLGLSVGAVLQHTEEGERRHVYRRDIVYGAMRELGFDYLRDNLKFDPGQRVQRESGLSDAVAIVDEADHALIDEAFTPMIISGNPTGSSRTAIRADRAVAEMIRAQQGTVSELAAELDSAVRIEPSASPAPSVIPAKAGIHLLARLLLAQPDNPMLQRRFSANPSSLKQVWGMAEEHDPELIAGLYYAIHPGSRFVTLTEKGREFLEQRLGLFYEGAESSSVLPERNLPLMERRRRAGRVARTLSRRYGIGNQVLQSLRARLLLKRDVDYLVDGDGVALIDLHTGRPKPDNIYQHGLQAAVEAKEGVTVRPDSETLAWISVCRVRQPVRAGFRHHRHRRVRRRRVPPQVRAGGGRGPAGQAADARQPPPQGVPHPRRQNRGGGGRSSSASPDGSACAGGDADGGAVGGTEPRAGPAGNPPPTAERGDHPRRGPHSPRRGQVRRGHGVHTHGRTGNGYRPGARAERAPCPALRQRG